MLWDKFSWLGITLWRFPDLFAILLFEVLTPEMYFSNYFTNAKYSGRNNFLCLLAVRMFMLVLSAALCQEKFMFKWLSLMTPELFSWPTSLTLDILPLICLPWNVLSNLPTIPSKLLLYKSSAHFLVRNSTTLWFSAFYPKCGIGGPKPDPQDPVDTRRMIPRLWFSLEISGLLVLASFIWAVLNMSGLNSAD